jgi:hypothetical protein
MNMHCITRSFLLLPLIILCSLVSSANTVEFVRLKVTSDPIPSGVSSGTSSSRELAVSGGRIVHNGNRYRMPFVTGENHQVTIVGQLTDMLDRVEIVHGNSVARTIRKSALVSAAHTEDHGGKGEIVFDMRASDLPGVGEDFQIRIRFAVETAGYDELDCKVAQRGRIERIEWTTLNGALLPEFNLESSGRTYADIERGRTYALRIIVFKAPSSVQIGDGIDRMFLRQPGATARKIDGRIMRDTVDVTFRVSEHAGLANAIDDNNDLLSYGYVNLADAGVGNIPNGWGSYLYSRIAPSLPGRSTAEPLVTNLRDVRVGGFSGGGGGGGTVRGPISGSGSRPTGQPDITVVIDNAFLSGTTFTADELARYRFCQTAIDRNGQRITQILPLTVKVTNTGTVDIDSPFDVTLSGGGNRNFFDDRVETIRSLHVGETYQIIVLRKQAVACAPGTGTGCPRCPDNLGGNGIVVWNDRGFSVNVDSRNTIAESNETNNTAAVAR